MFVTTKAGEVLGLSGERARFLGQPPPNNREFICYQSSDRKGRFSAVTQGDVTGLKVTDSPTFAGLTSTGKIRTSGVYPSAQLELLNTTAVTGLLWSLISFDDGILYLQQTTPVMKFKQAFTQAVVPISDPVYTVATLPAVATFIYCRVFVSDATQTLTAGIGAIVAGGGANKVPVSSDGTNWRIG